MQGLVVAAKGGERQLRRLTSPLARSWHSHPIMARAHGSPQARIDPVRCVASHLRPANPLSQAGFSIVELIVTLVIAAVLIGLAAPNMSIFLRNSARTTLLNDFIAGVQYARSQAVTRNQRVTLCPVDIAAFDSANPANGCQNSNSYELGWVVFIDNGAVDRQIDAGEQILRVFPAADIGDGVLQGLDGAGPPNAIDSLSFLGTGLGDAIPDGAHFKYCDLRDDPDTSARAVLVNASGQPRVSFDTADDGSIDNLDAGNDLSCP